MSLGLIIFLTFHPELEDLVYLQPDSTTLKSQQIRMHNFSGAVRDCQPSTKQFNKSVRVKQIFFPIPWPIKFTNKSHRKGCYREVCNDFCKCKKQQFLLTYRSPLCDQFQLNANQTARLKRIALVDFRFGHWKLIQSKTVALALFASLCSLQVFSFTC